MSSNVTESMGNHSDEEMQIDQEEVDVVNSQIDLSENLNQTEKEKKILAEKIRKENENFMKSMQENKIGRLKFLLNQTEIFAHFLVGHTTNVDNEKDKKGSKAKRKGNVKKENINLIKSIKENVEVEDVEMEAPQVTRLYYQPSILTGGKLTSYQLDGLNWLVSLYETGLNGILADEMGLGKTIQSIAFMSFLKQYKKKNGYFLVVVPKSTMPNWSKEIKLWCPNLNAIILNPIKEEREETLKKLSKHKFEVLITSYEGVNICISTLKKIKWECLIIDEAHRIKNENALLSRNVRSIESKFRLLVTGTPLQNNLHELWALLNFLLPDLFSSSEDFDEWFGLGNKDEENLNVNDQEEKNMEIVQQLHKILKPFLLRRTKSEVEKTLPPKKEIHIKVGLTENQKNLYKKLLTSSLISDSKTIYKNIIMQLRKVCNHPYLFEGVEDEGLPEIGDHLINVSSKMRILDKLLTAYSLARDAFLNKTKIIYLRI
jgi:SWI/SNF-related matrix-associated actin-dependent regulator of chromatin subfamily A member 5